MAIIQTGVTTGGNVKTWQCDTDDNPDNYPTVVDCSPGSTMVVIDKTTKTISKSLYFDGTDWNTI
jgi:hypothetical protein